MRRARISRRTTSPRFSMGPIFRAAVALWQKLGFAIVGTLPKVFRHPPLGHVDAYVMHRFLDDIEA